MSIKTEIKEFTENFNLQEAGVHGGLAAMAIAATLGVVPQKVERVALLPTPSVMSRVVENVGPVRDNALRREKESETAEQHLIYSIAQRTPGRTGKK